MARVVISVENLSKQFRLGSIGSDTLRDDILSWWFTLWGKKPPIKSIDEENDLSGPAKDGEYVWALKNISFDVREGDVLGLIGKNGSGKSTMLKILSKITSPTAGQIKIKGRLGSLLEVGTGFHTELSGLDNIYLNGSILGMKRHEITKKLDEIVDFAGVEKYLNTPVKRYSSGMIVRLGFAVAAHLDPEILIVDEVLSVGDVEFQKKCLGKMRDVSREGRTILFVSHNMSATSSLCNRGLYLQNGRLVGDDNVNKIIGEYMRVNNSNTTKINFTDKDAPGDDAVKLYGMRLIAPDGQDAGHAYINEPVGVEFTYEIFKDGAQPTPSIRVMTSNAEYAFVSVCDRHLVPKERGKHTVTVWIQPFTLNVGVYMIGVAATSISTEVVHFHLSESLVFDVIEDFNSRSFDYVGLVPGVVRPHLKWDFLK